jgi:hypothetical protein
MKCTLMCGAGGRRCRCRCRRQTQSCRHRGVPIPSRRGAFAARARRARPRQAVGACPCTGFSQTPLPMRHALLLTTWGMQLDSLCRTHCTPMPSSTVRYIIWIISISREKLIKPCVGSAEMLTMHGYVSVA